MKNLIEYIAHILRAAQKESGIEIPQPNDWVLILPRINWRHVDLPDEILGFKVFVIENLGGAWRCIEFDLAMSQSDADRYERLMRRVYRMQDEEIFSDDWSVPNEHN